MLDSIDLRPLLDGARAAVIATDRDYRVRYLNAAAMDRLKTAEAQAVGRPIAEWVPGEYLPAAPHPAEGWRVERMADGWAFFGEALPAVEPLSQRMLEAEQLAAV